MEWTIHFNPAMGYRVDITEVNDRGKYVPGGLYGVGEGKHMIVAIQDALADVEHQRIEREHENGMRKR